MKTSEACKSFKTTTRAQLAASVELALGDAFPYAPPFTVTFRKAFLRVNGNCIRDGNDFLIHRETCFPHRDDCLGYKDHSQRHEDNGFHDGDNRLPGGVNRLMSKEDCLVNK